MSTFKNSIYKIILKFFFVISNILKQKQANTNRLMRQVFFSKAAFVVSEEKEAGLCHRRMSHPTVAALCDVNVAPPLPLVDACWTHGVEQDGEEELPAVDELVQLVGAAGVVLVEDGVSEEATRLPGQHLPCRKRKNRHHQRQRKMTRKQQHARARARTHAEGVANGARPTERTNTISPPLGAALSQLQAVTPHIVFFQ